MNTQKEIIVRKATKEDAKKMIDYLNTIGGETDFLTFGKGDVKDTEEERANRIEATNSSSNCVLMVATIDNELVGLGSIFSSNSPRMKHIGDLGMSVKKDYWGMGVGSSIIENLITWSKNNGITRKINLLVREDNTRALKLYEKHGFVREGLLSRDFYINDKFYSSIQMGLEI
ncbi:N-acetyltransferase [Clostridioides difficile]|uniref:GNAT family N-acetyltransferase n=1 Tax=Bacillota TaxID=1239 RepID=UPI001C286A50|nr:MULTISPECIES: GNAT family N-acetyltransferase [Bacillota]MDB3083675.1 N-acetyltransferase [Clostridioides difficile]MBZ6007576.1 GNAT family N-acetyltransferase [Paraclostridium bifermentans]MDU0296620.1 GNAT family N-acetyltransferase [Paraclostridium sp. MRS3W1]UOW69735.1 GNAT family N-acetyltransferase [Paraclostridium bifermentans]GJG92700.1 acetyltransferase [Enterococcus faecium]